jgi:hypothetical protein
MRLTLSTGSGLSRASIRGFRAAFFHFVSSSSQAMSSAKANVTDYMDENTYARQLFVCLLFFFTSHVFFFIFLATAPPVHFHRIVLSRSDARNAQKLHLTKQFGLFMVGKWEKRAQRFKEIEEAKWQDMPKKKKAPKKEPVVAGEGVPVVSGKEKTDRVNALLARLKESESTQILLPTFSEELFELAQNEGPTHSRIGVTGLNHAYFAEDHGAFRHKGQLHDGVFGKEEEEGTRVQTQAKLRGMLVEHKLLPDLSSGLWDTDDVAMWDEWALYEKDFPQSEEAQNKNQWEELDADEVRRKKYVYCRS